MTENEKKLTKIQTLVAFFGPIPMSEMKALTPIERDNLATAAKKFLIQFNGASEQQFDF